MGMDCKSFSKLCADGALLDRKFTATDADIAFAKVVSKGQRRVALPQFEELLQQIAVKKGMDKSQVLSLVACVEGPVLHATRADNVRFHDDKTTYTGTHST